MTRLIEPTTLVKDKIPKRNIWPSEVVNVVLDPSRQKIKGEATYMGRHKSRPKLFWVLIGESFALLEEKHISNLNNPELNII